MDKGGIGILLHGREELEEGIHDKKHFSRFATEWEHWEPDDGKLKDPIRTHWLEDEEINELEKKM